MRKRAFLPLFLQFAEADFACVAANKFAGIFTANLSCSGVREPLFLQSVEADFACVAANLFAGNIRRDWLFARAGLPLFF